MVGNFTIGIFSTIFQKQPIIILYSIQYFLTKLLTISIVVITLKQLASITNKKLKPNLAKGEYKMKNYEYENRLKFEILDALGVKYDIAIETIRVWTRTIVYDRPVAKNDEQVELFEKLFYKKEHDRICGLSISELEALVFKVSPNNAYLSEIKKQERDRYLPSPAQLSYLKFLMAKTGESIDLENLTKQEASDKIAELKAVVATL
jgi:hypothetical protein